MIMVRGMGRRRPAAPRTGRRFTADQQSFGATTRRDVDMGAIAEAFVAYAQPLLDQTDGSEGQLNKAFAISQLCYSLAQMPEESRDRVLSEVRSNLEMDDEEFDDFRLSFVVPMIQRHQEMFPRMHMRRLTGFSASGPSPSGPSFRTRPETTARRQRNSGTDRYAPCPCNSGRKYKFCCGKKRL
jgi:hypothetical protein